MVAVDVVVAIVVEAGVVVLVGVAARVVLARVAAADGAAIFVVWCGRIAQPHVSTRAQARKTKKGSDEYV